MRKKTMYTVLITMLALSLALAASCATPAAAPATEVAAVEQPQATGVTPPPAQTAAPAPQSGDIILDGAKTHTVVRGDTLSVISRRSYGNDQYFPVIMLGSSDVSDPDEIELNTILTIPDLQKNLDNPGARAKIKSYLGEIADVYDKRNRPHYADKLRQLAASL